MENSLPKNLDRRTMLRKKTQKVIQKFVSDYFVASVASGNLLVIDILAKKSVNKLVIDIFKLNLFFTSCNKYA